MKLLAIPIFCLFFMGCAPAKKEKRSSSYAVTESTAKTKYLYVASGQCYSGNNTTFSATTSSNQVFRVKLNDGQKDMMIADYFAIPSNPGDSPVGISSFDNDNLLVLIENTAGRRLEKVSLLPSSLRSIFSSSSTVLSAALKGMIKTIDGGYIISKGSSIEKITSQGVRLGSPYVGSNLGSACGSPITNISAINMTKSGKIIFTHAAASQNRWGIISANGYNSSADCLAVQNAPNPNAFPTSVVYLPEVNQVIIAYAGNSLSPDLNSIYVYDFDETTNLITNPIKIYDSNNYSSSGYLLYGISTMAFDQESHALYVATAISNATTVVNYSIEKLNYDYQTKSLRRALATPFYSYGNDTKCISSMTIAE